MWDVAQHFERESHCLLLELDIWGNSLNALPQHVRVTVGFAYLLDYVSKLIYDQLKVRRLYLQVHGGRFYSCGRES